VYSLGVALWAILAGREPPPGGPDATLTLAPQLGALLNSMLERDRSRRISIGAVLARLPAVTAEAQATEGSGIPGWFKGLLTVGALFAAIALVGSKKG
jgi:hypothetical protein